MSIKVYCDLCDEVVDKTDQTNGFGALSVISKKYAFADYKRKDGNSLIQTNYDICDECCDKLMKFLEDLKPKVEETK